MDFHQENLRQIFTADGKREVCQEAKQRHADNDQSPQAAPWITKSLAIEARKRAGDQRNPNQKKTEKNLPVELGRLETETIENFTHKYLGRGFC